MEQTAKQVTGFACSGMLDLYIGYDEKLLTESSHDYTMFKNPYGVLCLTKLLMGWTNAVPVFHNDVMHILQLEIPQFTIPYIDDVPIHGPTTAFQSADGVFGTIPENHSFHHFIWDHFRNLNHIAQHMKHCGGTFSGKKSILCTHDVTIVGHLCTPNGHIPDSAIVNKIIKWGPCADLSEVHMFLGTISVTCIFIKTLSPHEYPLISLTCKDVPFVFSPEQIPAQEALKAALLALPTLHPINYTSDLPVILGVVTSHITVGFPLCQCDMDNPHIHCYMHFGCITQQLKVSLFTAEARAIWPVPCFVLTKTLSHRS